MEDEQKDYTLNFFGIFEVELWIFILSINLILLIASYVSYRIIFFHGYQVSYDKTLQILQSNSEAALIETPKKE